MMAGSRARRIWVLGLCGVLAAGGLGIGIGAGAPRAAPAPRQAPAASSATPLFAYYYIWFSRSSWSRAKKDLPLIGGYSSSDPAVLRHQIQQAKSAGIGGFIVSWKDTPLNDVRLRLLMTAAAEEHFKLAMIYQGLDFYRHPLPVSQVAADFVKFRDEFASSPVFFRVDGKPLTIWSGTWAFSYDQVAQVTRAVRPGMLVLCTEKNVAGFNRIASITDGDAYYWSSVNPATQTGYQAKLDQMSQAIHRDGQILDRSPRARIRRQDGRRRAHRAPERRPDPAHRIRHGRPVLSEHAGPDQLERIQRELLCGALEALRLPVPGCPAATPRNPRP